MTAGSTTVNAGRSGAKTGGWRGLRIECKILSSVYIALYLLLTVLYLFGTANVYGQSLSVLGALNHLIAIFKISKYNIYRTLVRFAFGLAYFIYAGILIGGTVRFFKAFGSMCRADERKGQRYLLLEMFGKTNGLFAGQVLMIMLAYMCTGSAIGAAAIVLVTVGILLSLSTAVMLHMGGLRKTFGALDYAVHIVKYCLAAAATVCLFCFLIAPNIDSLQYGVRLIFNGIYNREETAGAVVGIYKNAVRYILLAVAMLIFNRLLRFVSCEYAVKGITDTGKDSNLSEYFVHLIVYLAVIAAVDWLFVSGVLNGGTVTFSLFSDWARVSGKAYLSAIAACAAGAAIGLIKILPSARFSAPPQSAPSAGVRPSAHAQNAPQSAQGGAVQAEVAVSAVAPTAAPAAVPVVSVQQSEQPAAPVPQPAVPVPQAAVPSAAPAPAVSAPAPAAQTAPLTETARQVLLRYQGRVSAAHLSDLERQVRGATEEQNRQLLQLPLKSKTAAIVLAIFLGGLGIDRFYAGDVKMGVLKLVGSVVAVVCALLIPIFGFLVMIANTIWKFADIFISYKQVYSVNYGRAALILRR